MLDRENCLIENKIKMNKNKGKEVKKKRGKTEKKNSIVIKKKVKNRFLNKSKINK